MAGINLDSIRQKLQTLQKTGGGGNNLKWKPEEGENIIRLLPYKYREENPFLEMYFYWPSKPNKPTPFKKTTLSPISFGKPDPIMEFIDELQSTGSKEDWVTGAKMKPDMRIFVPILVRGKEKEGVKFWEFGKKVYELLLQLISDEDWGDITSLSDGRDLVVTLTKAKTANEYDKTTVMPKPKQTAVTADPDIATLIKNMPEITAVVTEATYESLRDQLKQWLNVDASDVLEESADATTPPPSKVETKLVESDLDALLETKPGGASNTTPSNVEAEFDELFSK